jgi:hypothetical protein
MVLNESDDLIPEAVIEEWVRQAGEPIVVPPGSHVTQLRQQILRATSERSPKNRGRVWWAGLAATVAVAASVFSLQLLRTDRLAWADMVEASRRQPWMYVLGTDVDGSRTEVWFSGLHRIQALKADGMTLFDDYSAKVRFVYVERENRILRSQLSPADVKAFEATASGFSQLFLGGTAAAETVGGLNDFSGQESRDIVIDGRTWIELTITHKNGDIGVYRVDPKTRLPIEWSGRVNGRSRGPSRFDFPTEGPKDIYMLGVPKDTRIEDRPDESSPKAETN